MYHTYGMGIYVCVLVVWTEGIILQYVVGV